MVCPALCTRREDTEASECSFGTGGMRREAELVAPLVMRMGVPTRDGVRERGVFGVLDIEIRWDSYKPGGHVQMEGRD